MYRLQPDTTPLLYIPLLESMLSHLFCYISLAVPLTHLPFPLLYHNSTLEVQSTYKWFLTLSEYPSHAWPLLCLTQDNLVWLLLPMPFLAGRQGAWHPGGRKKWCKSNFNILKNKKSQECLWTRLSSFLSMALLCPLNTSKGISRWIDCIKWKVRIF